MFRRQYITSFAAAMLMLCNASSAYAKSDVVSYLVVRQPVSQFFEQLERDTGVHIDASKYIPGVITNMRLSGSVEAVISQLSQEFGFHWFSFNNIVYVSLTSESKMRLVRLKDVSSADAMRALSEVGLASDRFPIIEAAQGKAIALTGPPKLLGLSEAIIESLIPESPDVVEVAVPPLSVPPLSVPAFVPRVAEKKARGLVLYRGTSWQVRN